jgi:hypothetical protein
MGDLRMSVGRDYNTASRHEYCIFDNEEIVAREGGFSRSNAARAAGLRKARALQEREDCTPSRRVPSIHPSLLAAATGDLDAVAPADAERAREIIALRLGSPKRSNAGKPVEQQQDAAHLPLFVHANEPKFI